MPQVCAAGPGEYSRADYDDVEIFERTVAVRFRPVVKSYSPISLSRFAAHFGNPPGKFAPKTAEHGSQRRGGI